MLDNIINGIFNFVTSDKFYLPVIFIGIGIGLVFLIVKITKMLAIFFNKIMLYSIYHLWLSNK